MKKPGAILCALALAVTPARPCTIFVLTDGERVLFFNNEDWFNRHTRLWFVPAGAGQLGCAYVGFDDGWAQGGVNSAGLAFDWVSGFDEPYTPAPELKPVRGNPAQRMLETCSTVAEAEQFFRTYLEPDFRRSRILVADRTGASVVIGAREGRLYVAKRNDSRGFGWGRDALEAELAKHPAPTVENGAAILRACLQPGEGGTKYSTIYDLKQGTIVLIPRPGAGADERVTLDLAAELGKGGHYYEIPHVREQLDAAPQPLLANMRRFYLDDFQPLAEQDPAVVQRLRGIIADAAAGRMRPADYAPELWAGLAPVQAGIQADMQWLGRVESLVLVERREEADTISYRCVVDFEHARVLGRYVFNREQQLTLIQSEFAESRTRTASNPD